MNDPRMSFFPGRKVKAELTSWHPKMNSQNEKRVRLDLMIPLIDETRRGQMPGWMIYELDVMDKADSSVGKVTLDVTLEGVTLEFFDTVKSPEHHGGDAAGLHARAADARQADVHRAVLLHQRQAERPAEVVRQVRGLLRGRGIHSGRPGGAVEGRTRPADDHRRCQVQRQREACGRRRDRRRGTHARRREAAARDRRGGSRRGSR